LDRCSRSRGRETSRTPWRWQRFTVWSDGRGLLHNPEHLRQAKERFHVANLYFNRKCTRGDGRAHPFGGFNMSGTDSKAGGPDYLLLFLRRSQLHPSGLERL